MTQPPIRFLVTDRSHRRVLVATSGADRSLPGCPVPAGELPDPMETSACCRLATRHLDLDLLPLFAVGLDPIANHPVLAAFEWRQDDRPCPAGLAWVDERAALRDASLDPQAREWLVAWFAEQAAASKPGHPFPWIGAGWFDQAVCWISRTLGELGMPATGPVEHVKSFYTGATLRVPTSAGWSYFKAASPVYMRDAAITRELSCWQPARIPAPLAIDLQRGWLFTAEVVGPTLREVPQAQVWCEVLSLYAQLQQDAAAIGAPGPGAGLYDWSILTVAAALPAVLDESAFLLEGFPEPLGRDEIGLWRGLLPRLLDLCAAVEAGGIPSSLEHCDLHSGNIRLAAKGPVFLDWAWSCRTHPFLGAIRLVGDAEAQQIACDSAQLYDAYLEAWSAHGPRQRLRDLLGTVGKWATLLHVVMDAEWLRSYRHCLRRHDLPEGLFVLYTLRRRQYYFNKVLRRLARAVL